jgi:hypothetical protein
MEIQVEDHDEDIVFGGYYCKEHFLDMFRKELGRLSIGEEVELAGLFAQNVIDVVMEGKELLALEKLFTEADAKPIAKPGHIVESMVEEMISDKSLDKLEEAVEELDKAAKEEQEPDPSADAA